MKLTKDDFKKNSFNLMLVVLYTFLLCVVYGTWIGKCLKIWWATLIVVVAIIIGGVICGIFWTKSVSKKNFDNTNNMQK